MKNKINIMNVLSKIVDPFRYKIISSKKMSEKDVLLTIIKEMGESDVPTEQIMSLLEYLMHKMDFKENFFDEDIKKCIILKGDYIIMHELLKYREVNIFTEQELQQIYNAYNNYEIRMLVEAKLWAQSTW